jgi:hypothetical protein
MRDRFPFLLILSQITKIVSWICLSFGFVVLFVILVGNLNLGFLGFKIEAGGNFFLSFLYFGCGLLAFLVLNGIAELILLFLSIEESLRRKA